MTQGLSERSLNAWQAFAQSAGSDASDPLDRDLLNHFVITVHYAGDSIPAHELKTLVDELDVHPDLAQGVADFVAPALALLQAYDRYGQLEDDEDMEVGPGVIVL